jgi:hypothetical protein
LSAALASTISDSPLVLSSKIIYRIAKNAHLIGQSATDRQSRGKAFGNS